MQNSPSVRIILPLPGGNYEGIANFRILMNSTSGDLVLPLGFCNFLKVVQKVTGFYKIPRLLHGKSTACEIDGKFIENT